MSRPLPPLSALRAFEATARHLSFSRAADELAVTPAALSHQIRGLEEFLGERLFHRKVRQIALTPAGELLYPGLNVAFTQIRQTVDLLSSRINDRVLVVSASPGFTAKWLAPRLFRFMMASPEIDTRVSASTGVSTFGADGVDVAIRNTTSLAPGLWSRRIADVSVLPLASPRLIEELGGLSEPWQLAHAPLIHDDLMGRLPGMATWSDWLEAAGVSGLDLQRGLHFSSPDHALEAAGEGAGVILAQRVLAHEDMRHGRLVAPFRLELPTERAFKVVCPSGHETRPKIKAFCDWLEVEVRLMHSSPHWRAAINPADDAPRSAV